MTERDIHWLRICNPFTMSGRDETVFSPSTGTSVDHQLLQWSTDTSLKTLDPPPILDHTLHRCLGHLKKNYKEIRLCLVNLGEYILYQVENQCLHWVIALVVGASPLGNLVSLWGFLNSRALVHAKSGPLLGWPFRPQHAQTDVNQVCDPRSPDRHSAAFGAEWLNVRPPS